MFTNRKLFQIMGRFVCDTFNTIMKTKYSFIVLIIILLLYLLNLITFIYYTIIIISFSLFGIYIAFKLNGNKLMKIHVLDNYSNQFSSINSSFDSVDSKTTNFNENYFRTRTLISRNVDQLIEQIIDFCLRDFVFIWYKNLVINCDQTFETKLK
jgi:hypothetical protein